MIRSNTYLKHVARCLAVSALVLAAIPATAQDTPTDKDLAALRYFVTAGDTEAAGAPLGFFIKRARVLQHLFGDSHYHLDRYAALSGF